MLQQNIQIMGGDPFQSSNGALQQMDQMNYSYGMFGNQGNQMPFNWVNLIEYYLIEFYLTNNLNFTFDSSFQVNMINWLFFI